MQFLEHPTLGRLPARRVLDCIFALTPAGSFLHVHNEQVAIVETGVVITYRLRDAPAADGRERCRIIPPRVREFRREMASLADAP